MQTSGLPPPLKGSEDADSSQKTAQNEGPYPSLAFASTGTTTASLHGSKPGSNFPSVCAFGEKNGTTKGYSVLVEDGPCLDHRDGKRYRFLPVRKRPLRSSWLKVALACSVTVFLCLASAALYFCVHLHYQMRDRDQKFQTVVKNLSSLTLEYEALRDDNLRLHKELYDYRVQNEMEEATNEDDAISSDDGQARPSSDALSQLLDRSNGLPTPVSDVFRRRAKRSVAEERYVESIVINYLRGLPKVHLRGINNITSSSEYRGPNNEYLVWQPDPDLFVHRGVTLKHLYHQHNRVKAIQIDHPGVYMVYSQVIINGTTIPAHRRDCAHQTVRLPYHDNNDRDDVRPHNYTVLLSGFLTQDSEGRYEGHSVPFPRDSSLQMGIFRLLRQDQVRVRVPECEDCRRTLFTTDLHSSYFGLFRIG